MTFMALSAGFRLKAAKNRLPIGGQAKLYPVIWTLHFLSVRLDRHTMAFRQISFIGMALCYAAKRAVITTHNRMMRPDTMLTSITAVLVYD
jgi:hypothetical protein